MTTDSIQKKIEISHTAVELFMSDGYISMKKLVNSTGNSASEIYSLFPNKQSILSYYYPSLVYIYGAMISEIEDFETYTLSEKLSNFIYSSFDMLNDQKEFVDRTIQKTIFEKGSHSEFHREVKLLFKEFFAQDSRIAVSSGFIMGDRFYSILATEYLHVVKFWLSDTTEGKESTFALTDKLTSFIEEVCYSKVLDKGFDLTKYLFAHAGLGKKIPFIGDCITDFFTSESKTSSNGSSEDE